MLLSFTDNIELHASLPAEVPRDLQPQWRGAGQLSELQDLRLYRNKVHGRHRLPESKGEFASVTAETTARPVRRF